MQYRQKVQYYNYDKNLSASSAAFHDKESRESKKDRTDDLIIEENTVYEIDQDCYERSRRSRINQKGSEK